MGKVKANGMVVSRSPYSTSIEFVFDRTPFVESSDRGLILTFPIDLGIPEDVEMKLVIKKKKAK